MAFLSGSSETREETPVENARPSPRLLEVFIFWHGKALLLDTDAHLTVHSLRTLRAGCALSAFQREDCPTRPAILSHPQRVRSRTELTSSHTSRRN